MKFFTLFLTFSVLTLISSSVLSAADYTKIELIGNITPTSEVATLAFSPDEKILAGGTTGSAILWDTKTGKVLHELSGHKDWVFGIAFSPDGKLVATGGANKDATIKIWDVESGELKHNLENLGGINCLAFSPNGKTLACGNGNQVSLWDVSSGKIITSLENYQYPPSALAFLVDEKTIITAGGARNVGKQCEIVIRNTASGEIQFQTILNAFSYNNVFSADGRFLALSKINAVNTGYIRVWRVPQGADDEGVLLPNQLGDPDNPRLIPGAKSGPVYYYTNVYRGKPTIAWSPDNKVVAIPGMATVEFWDGNSVISSVSVTEGQVVAVAFSPKGTMLAASSLSLLASAGLL